MPVGRWQAILAEIVAPNNWEAWRTARPHEAAEPLRLPHLVDPFLAWARRDIQIRLGPLLQSHVCDRQVIESHLKDLARELWSVAHRAMILEVNVARMSGTLVGATAGDRMSSFVSGVLTRPGGVRALYLRYIALGRALATVCSHWNDAIAELIQAFAADAPDIRREIFDGADPGHIVDVSEVAGDAHAGGRRTRILIMATGQRLVFKPRCLKGEAGFQHVVSWLNDRGLEPRLPTLPILARTRHGWTRYVEATGASDGSALRRYYARLGAFLPVLWIVRATDVHFENLVASGEDPIMIDLEALFTNPIETALRDESPSHRFLRFSVFESGILPRSGYSNGADGPSQDASVLGKRHNQLWSATGAVVEDGRTDEARIGVGPVWTGASRNHPRLHDVDVGVAGFEDDLVSGFRSAYGLIERHKRALLEATGPLRALLDCEVRIIPRPSMYYGRLRELSYHPDYLRDSLDREQVIVAQLHAVAHQRPRLAELTAAEARAIISHDLPRFCGKPRSRQLWSADGGRPTTVFARSAWSLSRERIRSLDSSWATREESAIRCGLALIGGPAGEAPSPATDGPRGDGDPGFVAEARAIGRQIRDAQVRRNARGDWFGLCDGPQGERYLAPLGPDLHEGAAGTAVFLAHLTARFPSDGLEEALSAAIETCRSAARGRRIGPGGAFFGAGGIAHALLRVGCVTGRTDLVDEAVHILQRRARDATRQLGSDIVSGLAGYTAVLLMAADAAPELVDRASALGRLLIERQVQMSTGAAWPHAPTLRYPLTGLAHGAAGIAMTLLRLGAVTGDTRFIDAGRLAIAYERAVFDSHQGHWVEGPLGPHFEETCHGWCYGLPGVLIARLGLPPALCLDADEHEMRDLATRLTRLPARQNDSLCHGDFGKLEALLCAAGRVTSADSLEHVRMQARTRLAERLARGSWRGAVGGRPHSAGAGFMFGLAGIGYQLLRLANPDAVPSVLGLQSPARRQPSRGRAPGPATLTAKPVEV